MPKDLTGKTTNQIIHEWLGKCWHEFDTGRNLSCLKCDNALAFEGNPDYENDLNAVREAELKAIEVYGKGGYTNALIAIQLELHGFTFSQLSKVELIYLAATAPASVRASAIVRLIQEGR